MTSVPEPRPRHCSPPDCQATSTPTTTDAKWGHFKRPRRGQCKRPLRPLPKVSKAPAHAAQDWSLPPGPVAPIAALSASIRTAAPPRCRTHPLLLPRQPQSSSLQLSTRLLSRSRRLAPRDRFGDKAIVGIRPCRRSSGLAESPTSERSQRPASGDEQVRRDARVKTAFVLARAWKASTAP